jgi:hypothetical protein
VAAKLLTKDEAWCMAAEKPGTLIGYHDSNPGFVDGAAH